MVLLTQMAKFCNAIRPPGRAKEAPPAEAFSCLDTDFTPDFRRLWQLMVLWHDKSHYIVQLDFFLKKMVVPYKRGGGP